MGPLALLARVVTSLIIHHGNLDEHIREFRLEDCLELQRSSVRVHLLRYLTTPLDDRYHAHGLQLPGYRLAITLVASSVLARQLRREKDWRKHQKRYSSQQNSSSKFSNYIVDIPFFLANISVYLTTLLVVNKLLSIGLIRVHSTDGILEIEKYTFLTSFWSVLVSILIRTYSIIWDILDPKNGPSTIGTYRKSWSWPNAIDVHNTASAWTAAVTFSVGAILWLSYTEVPLIRLAIYGKIDIGLPRVLIQAFHQMLSSFIGFCIFCKFTPIEDPAAPISAGVRKPKKFVRDPDLLKRMSMLAKEARECLQARKDEKRRLRRTYSEGNFRTPSDAPLTGRSLLSRNTEKASKHQEGSKTTTVVVNQYHSPNGVADIHLGGVGSVGNAPSTDLTAKLKENVSTKRSASSGFLPSVIPELHEEDEIAF
mmetsp:Transcript_32789/g.69185  ORF Transcript_32789/g.69185 Transcript_32789/m.69185 type:complete len:425 (-) Transcript_32789:201-1475(-)|eukprot:CAMPEP_0183732116 /NCGR_PEP_ID=MMETSP0737-20130205/37557_1 /TAXON_ID=385413 /ORGANISM="Thalassiosira miniscula, Strain CCMP1093" /LENGTH=424 /DNA_ID=CAMNT_0025965035 /DNA_START=18 /DNA_END=1292 /DNA_ORIENTATION=-